MRCMNMCIYRRCAACSELRNVRVSVHCGVHAIVRNVLKAVQVVREVVRSLPYPFVYRKMRCNRAQIQRCAIASTVPTVVLVSVCGADDVTELATGLGC